MTPILAMSMTDPLMLMFGILITAVLGCAAGFFLGTSMGATRPATPLPTTIQVTRERLTSTVTQLEKASTRLNEAQRSELAGTALVVSRRISELSSKLGSLGAKTRREQEGSA